MSEPLFPIALAIAMAAFGWTLARRARLLFAARPAGRFDRIPERIKQTIVYGFGQKKFLAG